jgi:glucose/arabinose dehydrogenase
MNTLSSSFRAAFGVAALALAAALIPPAEAADPKPVVVARGLVQPWGLAFLPDGRMLVTEKPGRLRIVARDGTVGAPVEGLPPVFHGGQCGLLDVVVDPAFAQNQRVWFTFAEPGDGGNGTAVARGRLEGNRLADVRTVFSQKPKVDARHHCGSRIVFDRQGRLWVGLGDRFARMADAQTLDNHLGKIVRIDADGKAPADNPFIGLAGAVPELWSIGHRNIQAMAMHPATGELWAAEHGPQGGDELNVAEGGRNYGWPVVTYGRNYGTGTRIGEEGPKPGIEMPLRHWAPTSVAPSGMAFVTSDRYPGWQGSLVMGTLRAQSLIRLTLDGRKVTSEQRLLETFGQRIRDVRQGPDGWLYLLTDSNDGQIVRLER